ncbi:MotA/TolQ/ExbB proton channel family protein [Vibrio genomosp. F10 str. 9ZC157]|uniref:MotA/TolQ/ExbB proton channel family protein n=1 Tax=Vibrio genomosp. F10 TaxID=723171 RepID=UPI0003047EF1|nr:MotA/TolQ/ExbB proton channel family protein [Vibrio genomosp. F10]OEE93753.1 flagellar motor protein MotA [Vibrio genomosp. F10 str. 9ZC157]
MKTLVLTISLALGLSFAFMPASAKATPQLVEQAKADNLKQKREEEARQRQFIQTEAKLVASKKDLEVKIADIQKLTDELTLTFSRNEETLSRLEEKLRLEAGSLGELFGVVRQVTKQVEPEINHSVTAIDANQYSLAIDAIIDAQALPSMAELRGLWLSMDEQIRASAQLTKVTVPVLTIEGQVNTEDAYRMGSFALVGEQGYLNWNSARQHASYYSNQPKSIPSVLALESFVQNDVGTKNIESGGGIWSIDPSRGIILAQKELEPSLQDRIEAGGVVGKIILGLLSIGLVIALYRGVVLASTQYKIRKQLRNPNQISNNPLGRVLSVYQKDSNRTVEALELRLLEAVVDEQTHLEKGLSTLKLFAALAPMLGLLGTVTGMIETFQVITHFGNSDPKVMAGGISMALVTTVLGLVAAMPLLLAHNILSTQAENIRNILEKQGIGLVAGQAEQDGGCVNLAAKSAA